MNQTNTSSIQRNQQPTKNSHLIQPQSTGNKRPSRFKPVRFQEYRMQWGGSGTSSMVISVSDVYVLDPECPALAAAVAATKLDDFDIDNRIGGSAHLPSDAELVAIVEAAAAASATTCGCRRTVCIDGARHQRHFSDNRRVVNGKQASENYCVEGGENYGVGVVNWTQQPSSFPHEARCPRRSMLRAKQRHQQRRQQQTRWLAQSTRSRPPLPHPTPQLQIRPRANSAFPRVENQSLGYTVKPPPSSPSEFSSTQTTSSPTAPPLPPPPPQPPTRQQTPPQQSDFAAVKSTNQSLQSPRTVIKTTATSATSPTTSDDQLFASGIGSAQSCAESCVATVAQVLQDALLAAVRAETEPLERQLAEKDAELRRLRQELRDRDARLRRLNRLLIIDGFQEGLNGVDGDAGSANGNRPSTGTPNGRGYESANGSTSALSSLL